MRRLVMAELSRLVSRRLTWVAVIAVLLAVGGLQVAVYQSVQPLTPSEIAEGQQQYQQALKDYEQNKADYQLNEQQCVKDGNPPDQCDMKPKPDQYTYRTPLAFGEIVKDTVTVGVFLTGLAVLLVGASFIGAEFSSGAIANWLSFIPERTKVFAAKLVALVLGTAVLSAVASALTIGVAALLTRAAGAHVGPTSGLVQMAGRGVVVAVICGVIGFGLALVTRHTIAAAASVLGYLLVTFVLSLLGGPLPSLQDLKPWLPENNVLAFLDHGYHYLTYTTIVTAQGQEQVEKAHLITFAHSAWYWLVVVVVAVGASWAVFRTRDVN